MNNICVKCDSRIRLNLCDGKNGDFKYCFRRNGSLDNIENDIIQFNTLDELYDKYFDKQFSKIKKSSLNMKEYTGNTDIVFGIYEDWDDEQYPLGFITK